MKRLFLLILLGIFFSSSILSQDNRVSVQSGLFHFTFDKSPLINKDKAGYHPYWKNPSSYLGTYLNESIGINYERKINEKSAISMEYMLWNSGRAFVFPSQITALKPPYLMGKSIKKINISYHRKFPFLKYFNYVVGAGVNYLWGAERIYLFSVYGGWGYEPQFYYIQHNDFGLNARTGIEYSPLKWLTLYTNFDFLGIAYLGAFDENSRNAKNFFKEKYNISYYPSRWDISWQFGIGFNFK